MMPVKHDFNCCNTDPPQPLPTRHTHAAQVGEAQKQKARLHVPYRDSKLTFLLQDSIGGNARTALIACVNPSTACVSETLSTLQFARCAGAVCNTARTNVDTRGGTAAMHLEIERLRRLLSARQVRSLLRNWRLVPETAATAPAVHPAALGSCCMFCKR